MEPVEAAGELGTGEVEDCDPMLEWFWVTPLGACCCWVACVGKGDVLLVGVTGVWGVGVDGGLLLIFRGAAFVFVLLLLDAVELALAFFCFCCCCCTCCLHFARRFLNQT